MRDPTSRKCRNRGLQTIRYHDGQQVRHGWIVKAGTRGALTVHLIGDERNRRLSRAESAYVRMYDNRGGA